MSKVENTKKRYGFLWEQNSDVPAPQTWHFNLMKEAINEPIIRGSIGIDVGSGCGYDTYVMAKDSPGVKIVSVDISDGIYNTKRITQHLSNVNPIKASALELPLRDSMFDFAYSYGVLHHTPDPKTGFLEIARILKKNSPAFIYLYEDHSENFIKFLFIKITDMIRMITVKIPPKPLYVFSKVLSPLVFIFFCLPAKCLMKFRLTENLGKKIPFNFGTGFFSLQPDLYDRFSAPIEYRFSRQEVHDLFTGAGFYDIKITRLTGVAGWVSWGYKK